MADIFAFACLSTHSCQESEENSEFDGVTSLESMDSKATITETQM